MKSKYINSLSALSCTTALAMLLALPAPRANAQGCATGLGASIQLDKSVAHIGDTVTVTLTRVSTAAGDCNVNSLVGWIVKPNNVASLNMTNVTLTSPQTFTCVGPSGGSCVPGVVYSHVITAGDVARNLSFDTPQGNSCVRNGTAKTVRFLFAAEGTAETSPVTSTAFACNNAPVTIITPGIACAKFCSNGVGENGQITFSGFVTNTGDTILNGVIVSNLVNGAMTLVTNIATLNIGQAIPFGGSYLPANPCVPTQDTIFVRGTDSLGLTVTSQCSATCSNILTPCIVVTKDCNTVAIGQPNTVSGIVTNCGNVTINNIQVTDNLYGAITTIASLAPGASASYSKLVTNANCGNFPNTVTAAGTTRCGQPIQDTDNDVCIVTCAPQICVTKEVVCELPTGCATNWSKLAIGVKDGDDCPSFCYRIRVTNCGQEALRDVTVTDPNLSLASCNFPTTLAVGQTVECIIAGVERCDDLINTVEAVGVGVGSGIRTNDTDFAEIKIREISITCEATVNGQPFIQIPCDGQPHVITNAVRVCNTGDLPLSDISIFAPNLITLGGACADVANLRFSLGVGECTNIVLCVDAPACDPDCGIAFSNFVHITARVDLSKTNVCVWTRDGTNGLVEITAETECEAVVGCVAPNACRVTGGGRQDDPLAFPHNVRYVTHGGQVGAPVGNKVCEVTDDFYLGNPCIHGRWTHVRHVQGGLRGNFHARYYDTLDCVCLDTNTTVQPSGFGYNNLVYGAGTVEDQVCNADDHKVAGPQPRPAPANKIVFTGVGDWADPNGRRAPRACLFRVDIEDRSEPGGSHPRGSVDPADRYRIRIWVLTNDELANLRGAGAGATKYLKGFRTAIGACNGLNVVDGATVPNGAAAFGVRAPDIDDGGELERGNHQIHPAIKQCDPYNPTGPGLPPGGN